MDPELSQAMEALGVIAVGAGLIVGVVVLVLIVGTWICIAMTASILADRKNRMGGGWFLSVLIFPPLILPLLALDTLPVPATPQSVHNRTPPEL